MKFVTLLLIAAKHARKLIAGMSVPQVPPLLLGILLNSAVLVAQQPVSAADLDKQTVQMLLQRIDQLETRVAQLEGARQGAPVAEATPDRHQANVPPEHEAEQPTERTEPDRMDLSKTLLRIRGFGDISLHGDNQKGSTTSFSLGQLNLFVTSDISDKFKFISEIVFEAGTTPNGSNNAFGVEAERYLLQYSPNDHFSLAVGRYHTAIGYYNTAYHHSSWLQTTTGRPFLFAFEDEGGILPIHNVGVSASGLIPSGGLGLHYIAELGNGRASRHRLTDDPAQNEVDENNHKTFNLALFVRPEAVQGLQVGFSGYRDVLTPAGGPRIGETILDAYAVFTRPNVEWLSEGLLLRHAPEGLPHVFQTSGFYTQISRRFGPYRPYFRYQYVNAPSSEPVFPDVGRRHGPSVGLRYDASESVALKLQYDYTAVRRQQAINALALQVGFTF